MLETESAEINEVHVRWAQPEDFLWCIQVDDLIPQSVLERKIEQGEILLAEIGNERVGILRLEFLWSLVPYLGFIWVLFEHRGKGVSRALLNYLEDHLRREGHQQLLSSSQADEPEPQAWHSHMGFEECGYIAGVNRGGVGEVFFRKSLVEGRLRLKPEHLRLLRRARAVASEWSPAIEDTIARIFPSLSREAVEEVAKGALAHLNLARAWLNAHQKEDSDCERPGHPGSCLLLLFQNKVTGNHMAQRYGQEAGGAFVETFQALLQVLAQKEAGD